MTQHRDHSWFLRVVVTTAGTLDSQGSWQLFLLTLALKAFLEDSNLEGQGKARTV